MILSHFKIYKYAYLWAIVVTILCGTNGNSLPHFDFSSLIRIDKIAHLFLFGTETFLIAIAAKKLYYDKTKFQIIFPAFLIGTAFGIIIEILQATVFINRSFDYLDMIANTIGCALAWIILEIRFKRIGFNK
jgi:VanZ family protein